MFHDTRKNFKHIDSIIKKIVLELCAAQGSREHLRNLNFIVENDAKSKILENAAETSILSLKMFVLELWTAHVPRMSGNASETSIPSLKLLELRVRILRDGKRFI